MRLKHSPARLLIILPLIFLITSCSADKAANILLKYQKYRKARQYAERQKQVSEGLVTLEPPYKPWNWGNERTKLSVQNAVYAICRQVGVTYNREKSYTNTDPLCRMWVTPWIKDKPWREAIEEVLAPYDLTYIQENRQIVLMKKEDALKREQEIEGLKAEFQAFISGLEPEKLPDAVVILPMVDATGTTTRLGTLLAEMGMLKAVYVPQKVLNLHVPAVLDLYDDKGYHYEGKTISEKDRDQITRRYATQDFAVATLEIEGGSFHADLHFEGQHGKQDFSFSGTEEEIFRIPQWIARCVHQYAGIELSPEQEQYVDLPEIRDQENLIRLAELEHKYWNDRRNMASWNQFLDRNPDSVYALYRIHCIAKSEGLDESLDQITAALEKCKDHDFLKSMQAQAHHQNEDYSLSVRTYFELIKNDFRNLTYYDWLDTGMLAMGLGEQAEALYQFWQKNDPDSYVPLLGQGDFYISYAWDARGGGWSGSVSDEGRAKFKERLRLAEEVLLKALERNHTDPNIASNLLIVAKGLGHERAQMEEWFQLAIQADPTFYEAYRAKLEYLKPKWYGDRRGEEMFAFARQCAANPPEGSRVGLLILNIHSEFSRRWAEKHDNDWRPYYRNPEVYREVKQAYEKYLLEHPESNRERNALAEIAVAARQYEDAVYQFEIIGEDRDPGIWNSSQFEEWRKEAYEKTGRTIGGT
ncbi:MAG: DUF4034 domain-containing protein [Candidatus Abyssobacteria bacterium SURF_5]|uniref:DUF4034 domain-containing protein n=1 Tax=Abyssobacteria bacterium (strain SURF_5) TaxID=2093360 RepID=A0A3A4P4Z4_ABYX5|nr:MAG: DUF4034 domain-containing protein [Candidatus Abyssubacteria bacterium SURF_5]